MRKLFYDFANFVVIEKIKITSKFVTTTLSFVICLAASSAYDFWIYPNFSDAQYQFKLTSSLHACVVTIRSTL